METINEKTSKQGLVNFLKTSGDAVKTNTSLLDRVVYTLKKSAENLKEVAKADLFDLATEVQNFLNTPAQAPVEAALKPKEEKKTTKEKSAPKTESTPKTEDAPKAADKKTTKKGAVEAVPSTSTAGADKLPSAKIFPKTIDHDELGKLIACTDMYTTYAEVVAALEAEKTLYFACYWTTRHIKEYGYNVQYSVTAPKKGFPNDLDICMAVLPLESMERFYALSRYTEAMYRFDGEDLEYVESTDERSGDKFKIRVAAGMEYEIYAPAEEFGDSLPEDSADDTEEDDAPEAPPAPAPKSDKKSAKGTDTKSSAPVKGADAVQSTEAPKSGKKTLKKTK